MLVLLQAACAPTVEAVELTGALSGTDAHAARFEISGEGEVELRCATAAGADVHRLSTPQSPPAPVVMRGLLADTLYRCAATRDGARSNVVELTTPPLPTGLPVAEVTIPGDPVEVGFHLVNLAHLLDPAAAGDDSFSDEFLAIVDAEGRPRWQFAGEGGGDIDATWVGADRILYGGFGADASTAPTIRTLDGEVVLEAPDEAGSPWQVSASWHHDVGLAADGESLWVLAEEAVPAADDPETTWEGFVVQQLSPETGAILWSWSSMDDGVASGALDAGDRYDIAPFHANAVWDVEEAGGLKLYVSLRNLNQVVRIDVATRLVDLRIGLGGDLALLDAGGEPAEDTEWFFGQHDVKRIGDLLVVYDNGLNRTGSGVAHSRALVLELDEAAKTARIQTQWIGDTEWITPAWGGLDLRADGGLEVAVGNFWWVRPDSTQRSALALLHPDASGGAEQAWRLDFPSVETALYRSERLDGCALFDLQEACP
ncbi:MAG: aryl-sulfate sulfotransferase [Pseudomonadota bacterium]|nr:aryl-sulfate sulfotransferase [Pseudomonadota bacterium]